MHGLLSRLNLNIHLYCGPGGLIQGSKSQYNFNLSRRTYQETKVSDPTVACCNMHTSVREPVGNFRGGNGSVLVMGRVMVLLTGVEDRMLTVFHASVFLRPTQEGQMSGDGELADRPT